MKFELNKEVANFIDVEHINGTFSLTEPIEHFIKTNTATYFVRKHDQSLREITVPSLKLKIIQKWILDNILSKINVSRNAHGFVKGKSIMTNVQAHIHDEESWLLRVDIKNFFPSICIESIVEIFERLEYSKEVSKTLAGLCSKDGKLCQGFPTSPSLANIYMIQFDIELDNFITTLDTKYDLVYTRYADDIIVSGLKKEGYTHIIRRIKNQIDTLISSVDLEINERKTSVQKKERKKLTGLYIVNDKIVLPKRFLKVLESEIYYCQKYGILGHLRYHNKLDIANFKGYMYGKVAFIRMIDSNLSEEYRKKLDKLDW